MNIRLSEKNKERCRKSTKVIPHLFTFLNALFGFLAIVKALEGAVVIAGYCIMLAALMDACDGRLARALKVTSCFGAELDSLSDAISFCLAPAILVYCWYPSPLGIWELAVLGFYLCAGLGRLARFNSKANNTLPYSLGLTTTVSAFCVASLPTAVLVHQYVTLAIIGILACLMPSNIRFPLFKKRVRINWWTGITFLGALGFCIWLALQGYPVLFMSIAAFIMTVVLYNLIFRTKIARRALLFLAQIVHWQ
jgi:CDP-diacylglycerol--serine O-phosphatidyltransferase